MRRPVSLKIIMLLALVQGLAGLFRGFNWIQIGVDLFGRGILLLPLVGTFSIMHGLFIWGVALLYVSFVLGALLGSRWAWWSCLIAVAVNLFLALSAFVQGSISDRTNRLVGDSGDSHILFIFTNGTGRAQRRLRRKSSLRGRPDGWLKWS